MSVLVRETRFTFCLCYIPKSVREAEITESQIALMKASRSFKSSAHICFPQCCD